MRHCCRSQLLGACYKELASRARGPNPLVVTCNTSAVRAESRRTWSPHRLCCNTSRCSCWCCSLLTGAKVDSSCQCRAICDESSAQLVYCMSTYSHKFLASNKSLFSKAWNSKVLAIRTWSYSLYDCQSSLQAFSTQGPRLNIKRDNHHQFMISLWLQQKDPS
jgi:hypothetical protein